MQHTEHPHANRTAVPVVRPNPEGEDTFGFRGTPPCSTMPVPVTSGGGACTGSRIPPAPGESQLDFFKSSSLTSVSLESSSKSCESKSQKRARALSFSSADAQDISNSDSQPPRTQHTNTISCAASQLIRAWNLTSTVATRAAIRGKRLAASTPTSSSRAVRSSTAQSAALSPTLPRCSTPSEAADRTCDKDQTVQRDSSSSETTAQRDSPSSENRHANLAFFFKVKKHPLEKSRLIPLLYSTAGRVCIYLCIYVFMYLYFCLYIYLCVCVCVCLFVCLGVYLCASLCCVGRVDTEKDTHLPVRVSEAGNEPIHRLPSRL
jgi:hypothetical protein